MFSSNRVLVSFRCYKPQIVQKLKSIVLVSFRCYSLPFPQRLLQDVLVSFRCYIKQRLMAKGNNEF